MEVVGLLGLVALLCVCTKVLVLVVLDCRYEGALLESEESSNVLNRFHPVTTCPLDNDAVVMEPGKSLQSLPFHVDGSLFY